MIRIGILVAAMLVAQAGLAQDELPMRGPGAERIEQYKKLRLMEELKLDDETSIRFFSRYNQHREDLRKLNERRNILIDELQSLRRRNASDEQYQKVLRELRSLVEPAIEIRESYFDDLSKILTPRKMAEYMIFERNFLENLREVMRETQRNRRGRSLQ